jgi:hypothetical protein
MQSKEEGMTSMTVKDARDLSFLTRDQAVEIIIRLMEERDACVEALEGVMYWDNGKPEWETARAAIAKATGGQP